MTDQGLFDFGFFVFGLLSAWAAIKGLSDS